VLPLLVFCEKMLMSDVLAANLMLTELLFFPNFTTFQDEDSYIHHFYVSLSHQFLTLMCIW